MLQDKYNELNKIDSEIKDKYCEIETIKVDYNHDFNKVKNKKNNYEENIKDYEYQSNEFNKMKNKFEVDEAMNNEKIKALNTIIKDYTEKVNIFQKDYDRIYNELKTKEVLFKKENEISVRIHLNNMKLMRSKEDKNKYVTDIQNLEVEIKRNESDIMMIDLKLPTLEEEKKSYISQKMFKEASKINSDLSEMNNRKSEGISKMKVNRERIHSMKLDIENVLYF